MRSLIRKITLLTAVFATLGLSACLPEDKNPDQAEGAGQMSGAFYGNGLGSVALSLQNAIVTTADWFSHVTSGQVDLAAMGISSAGMGTQVKSYLCPDTSGIGVKQIVWIDARDGQGKFALRGVGTDAGSIVGALRNRVGGNQVGVYKGGSDIALVNGENFTIPAGCSGAQIPVGAPVLAFIIDRPAAPTSEMARTEYRTIACGADSTGRAKRGIMVQSRTLRYFPDGSITPSGANDGWTSDINSMGGCMNDVVVQVTQRDFMAGQGTVNMNNFAAIALRTLLQDQLRMDCSRANVMADMEKQGQHKRMNKGINTCPLAVNVTGAAQVSDSDMGDATDQKILDCKGITALILRQFPNLYSDGLQNTVWTAGTATLLRTLDNRANDAEGQQAKRYKWLGTQINCTGYQTFYASCPSIPGAPPLEARHQGNKWNQSDLGRFNIHRTWLAKVFGCVFGCREVTGGEVYSLNPEYFTGTDQVQNNGNTTMRSMGAFSWDNNETFVPHSGPTSIWHVADNQCLWSQRVMIANCPFVYDPSSQGSWGMTHISAASARPVALDPGIPGNGSDSSNIYIQTKSQGYLTALVVLHWKKCGIKGCDRWDETFGPGTGSYIKSWNGVPPDNNITLSENSVQLRNQMCHDIDYQLNAYSIMNDKNALKNNAQGIMNQSQAVRDAAQSQLNNATNSANEAYNNMVNAQNAINDNANAAAWWYDQANHAFDTYNYMNQANADYDWWYNYYWNYGWCYDYWSCGYNGYYYDPYYYGYGYYSPPYNGTDINNAYWSGLSAYNTAIANGDYYQNLANNGYGSVNYWADQYNNRVAALSGLQSTVDAAQNQFNTAQNQYNVANNNYIEAKAVNDQHLQHPLTQEEITGLQTAQANTCQSSSGVLDEGSQVTYKDTCDQYYASPGTFATVPTLGTFCDTTFVNNGGSLSFRDEAQTRFGGDVQTTLLNTEGVDLAWKPVLEGNLTPGGYTILTNRQRGFVNPLMCARSEYDYIQWPVIQYYYQCGGKGGCRLNTRSSTATITRSTAREWSGLSYETGTWSVPQTVYITPWGNYGDISQIPNPMYTW